MHTGKRNPLQIHEDEQYTLLSTQINSGKLTHNRNKLLFLASNSSIYFATIDYETRIKTKTDYSINHVFNVNR